MGGLVGGRPAASRFAWAPVLAMVPLGVLGTDLVIMGAWITSRRDA